jgi:hypothetical protein
MEQAPQTATNSSNEVINKAANMGVDLSIFPDGVKTSGQHDPIYDQIYPYESFPKQIPTTTPTYWEAADYSANPSLWQHPFSPEELASLSDAADTFIAQGLPLTAISPTNFRLSPTLTSSLNSMRNELLNGKGFLLYKNLPVHSWGIHKTGVAYFGLGSHLGLPVSQNGKGHILGHVKDLGDDASAEETRIYRTTARQFFHADECDIVGLLCVARAMEGGESDIASSHRVWNVLQQTRPEVAKLLTQPIWYFDRKGEVSHGQAEWIRAPVFYLEPAASPSTTQPQQRIYSKWDPYYVRSMTRFSNQGLIPPLTAAQAEAMDVLEDTCQRVALHMVLEVGDIQFVANSHVLHARTEYKDWAPHTGRPRRHLMRLWLATSEDEGGWRLPFSDSRERKRGGIQVDDTPPVARLDAD